MRAQTIILLIAGLSIRLLLVFPGQLESKIESLSNKADLRNYYWPAQAVVRGENPYALWAIGRSEGYRADIAPLELCVFVVSVSIWDDPRAIQILFVVADLLNILLLGNLLKNSRLRLPFQVFYALGPLTLYNLVLVPQDKTILFTLTFLLISLIVKKSDLGFHIARFQFSNSYPILIIFIAALVAAFKWLSIFYLLPLLLFLSSDLRNFVAHAIIFAVVVGLSHLPWFPDWFYVYQFRSARVATPLHIAPAVLLNAMGITSSFLILMLLALSLLVIYMFYWRKWVDILETIVLATMAGVLWAPDMDPVHLSIVVLGFLLIIDWSSRVRQVVIWAASAWVTFVYAVSTHAGFARLGWQTLTGGYGSPQMILLSYPLAVAVFAFYFWDKWCGREVGLAVIRTGVSKP